MLDAKELPYANWNNTSIEYAVFKALGLNGYSDNTPACGYSHHPVMVPDLNTLNAPTPSEEAFTDFNVLTEPALCKHYVQQALRERGFSVGFVLNAERPTAALVKDGKSLQVAASTKEEAICSAVLTWFDVKEVPGWVASFDAERQTFEFAQECNKVS